eukprot:1601687-Prymnesium_polylepis.1
MPRESSPTKLRVAEPWKSSRALGRPLGLNAAHSPSLRTSKTRHSAGWRACGPPSSAAISRRSSATCGPSRRSGRS